MSPPTLDNDLDAISDTCVWGRYTRVALPIRGCVSVKYPISLDLTTPVDSLFLPLPPPAESRGSCRVTAATAAAFHLP